MPIAAMAWIAGVLIAGYVGFIGYGLLAPVKQRDPQMGMAIGCLTILLMPGLVLAAMLAIGLATGREGVVRVTFWMVMAPAGYLLLGLIVAPILRARRRRREAQWLAGDASSADESPSHQKD